MGLSVRQIGFWVRQMVFAFGPEISAHWSLELLGAVPIVWSGGGTFCYMLWS